MFCTNCGKPFELENHFCTACGSPRPAAEKHTDQRVTPIDAPGGLVAAGPSGSWSGGGRSPQGVTAAFAALAVLVILAIGGVAWYMADTLRDVTAESKDSISVEQQDAAAPSAADDTNSADRANDRVDEPSSTDGDLGLQDSYANLHDAYVHAGNLSREIGQANSDGTYGGTGFAYERFNPRIGAKERGVRIQLSQDCDTLLAKTQDAYREVSAIDVDSAYASDHRTLVQLYQLLIDRVAAMSAAAEAAVESPDESAWRSLLTPASTEARQAFDELYPYAVPVSR